MTPEAFNPVGILTSNGYPFIWLVMGQRMAIVNDNNTSRVTTTILPVSMRVV